MAFRWRADDGPLSVLFGSSFPSSKKKLDPEFGTPLAKLSGSAHALHTEITFCLSFPTNPCVNLLFQTLNEWIRTAFAKIRRYDIESKTAPSRIVSRSGRLKIHLDQVRFGKQHRYWRNPLPLLLDMKWRWIFLIFSLSFMLTWFIFAIIYYVIAKYHGDIDASSNDDHNGCLVNVGSFTAAFLFSIESQHTIGYGFRSPSSECSAAVFTVFIQFIFGLAVQCITAGLVVAKLQMGSRSPKAILFSEKACIGKCNDKVCLMVRVGNAGRSELVGATAFGVAIERQKSITGEEILTETYLEFKSENESSNLNLLWPSVIHYTVDGDPSAFIAKLRKPTTELLVTVEGTMCSTGQALQLRTSYLAPEIIVGWQFVDISPQLVQNTRSKSGFHHDVDYSGFDETQPDVNWDRQVWSGKVAT